MNPSTQTPRLVGWWLLVGVVAFLGYLGRADGGRPEEDVLFRYSTFAYQLVFLAIILGVALLVAMGAPKRDAFGLRPPRISLGRTLLIALGVLVVVNLVGYALDPVLQADEEQGLTTGDWIPGRALPFALNVVVFALVGPLVEELVFRGIGYRLFEPYGQWSAIAATALAFGIWHGLVNALPILIAFGAGLAYLRARSASVYPCIVLHGVFNGLAIAVSVST